MAIPANSILELKVGYLVNSQQCFNVFHYKSLAEIATGDELTSQEWVVETMGENANGEFPGEFAKLMSDDVVTNYFSAQWIWPVRWKLSFNNITGTGAIAEPCTAQNLQLCINKSGDLGNRHNVGSLHIGGLPETAYVGGDLTGAHLTLANALKNFLGQTLELMGDPAQPVYPAILNKEKVIVDGKEKYVISGSTQITAFDVRTTLRTQRTRTKGHGI
jgi:hypothetical protein